MRPPHRAGIQASPSEPGSSAGVGLVKSFDVAPGWTCIPGRRVPRDLETPTGAGIERNSARLNFGFMENMVIKKRLSVAGNAGRVATYMSPNHVS